MGQLKISQLPDGTAVTGTEFIPVIQNGRTVKIPAGELGGSSANVIYKAAPSLTQADTGKIVSWSKDGATVGVLTGTQAGALGQWRLLVDKPPALPIQREIYFNFAETTIADGDSFSFSGIKDPDTFYFRNTPSDAKDVQLGETIADTLANFVAKINADSLSNTLPFLNISSAETTLTVKTYRSTNTWAGSQSMFGFSYSISGVRKTENTWTDGCLSEAYNFKSTLLFPLYDKVSFEEIFSRNRSNGYFFAGYRIPETLNQYRDNIREAYVGYWWYLVWSDSGTSGCVINQNEFREKEVELYFQKPGSWLYGAFTFTVAQASQLPKVGSVPGHVLGRLVSLAQGNAYVDSSDTLKVKIAGNVSFDRASPRTLYPNRLGILYTNGSVMPLTASPDFMEALDDGLYSNGIQLFEFLEEGKTGDEIYARSIPIGGK